MHRLLPIVTVAVLMASSAFADPVASSVSFVATSGTTNPWHVSWSGQDPTPAPLRLSDATPTSNRATPQDAVPPVHAAAVEHSDAYQTRRKLHKIASFATLPLFGAELALGQSLYNDAVTNDTSTSGGRRTAHGIVGAAITGLFAVNTITGVWNLFGEDRHDPKGRTLRLVHGLLMMAADVGFLATTASAPGGRTGRDPVAYDASKATHRTLAIASIGVATSGYLIMIIGSR